MDLKAVSLAQASIALGVRNEHSPEISRRGLADACRKLIASKGSAPLSTVVAWARKMLAAVDVDTGEAEREVNAVIDSLVLLGDLGIAHAYGERVLVLRPRSFVALPDGQTAVLGGAHADEVETRPENNTLTRYVPQNIDLEPAMLADELESPSFVAALREMGYPATRATSLLHLRAALPGLLDSASVVVGEANIEKITSDSDSHPVLSGHIGGKPAIYRVAENGSVFYRAVPDEDFLAWSDLAMSRAYIDAVDQLDKGKRIPRQLARAFLICGACRPDEASWAVGEDTAAFINAWLGTERPDLLQLETGLTPDSGQRQVVEAPSRVRLLVEAGPGSGKTWVACERVAHLLRQDIAAPKIWLLSFTRAAVEEIRERIGETLGAAQRTAGVNISTFDSLAGRLHAAFGDETGGSPIGYEAGIRKAIRLLKSEDLAVTDFLGQIEHIIVDEAQDLVGARKLMVIELLKHVGEHCGITVFADPAQSIYGYQEKSLTGSLGRPFLRLLEADTEFGFSKRRLVTDHRTKKETLRNLFVEARTVLGDPELSPPIKYDAVRELIERSADRVLPPEWDQISVSSGSTMMLFRSHRDVLVAANRLWKKSALIRFRLTGRNPIIAPWIGATLNRLSGLDQFGRQDFSALWREVWPPISSPEEEKAWAMLRRAGGAGAWLVSVATLCDRIERSAPLELVSDCVGERGPVLSTIHGAKGREAEQIVLMLPRRPREENDVDWEEEARVLFVGATRAKKSLLIGPGGQYLRQLRHSKRFWRPVGRDDRGSFLIEVGLDGDVLAHEDFCRRLRIGAEQQEEHARRVWGLSGRAIPARATLINPDGCYAVIPDLPGKEDASPVACLSEGFGHDLRVVTGLQDSKLPPEITGFWINGVRTVIARTRSEPDNNEYVTGSGRPALVPVICGLASFDRE